MDVPPSNPFLNFIDRMAVLNITLDARRITCFIVRAIRLIGHRWPHFLLGLSICELLKAKARGWKTYLRRSSLTSSSRSVITP